MNTCKKQKFGSIDPNYTHLPSGVFFLCILLFLGGSPVKLPHVPRGNNIPSLGRFVDLNLVLKVEEAGVVA
jgi:hypothetical protein